MRALVTALYITGALLSVLGFYRPRVLKWAMVCTSAGLFWQSAYLVQVARSTGQIPVTTLGSWGSVFVWVIVVLALTALWVSQGRYRAMAGFLLPIGATFWLVDLSMASTGHRLHLSGWLPLHIGLATLAVVGLLLSAVMGLMYTEKERELRQKSVEVFYYRLPALQEMDRWSARFAAFGLGFWLLALLAGHLAETTVARPPFSPVVQVWSLFTAAMYVLYFALRVLRGWRGRPAAVMVMVLFLLVLMNLLALTLS